MSKYTDSDITVVITYWNREKQLLNTLKSIKHDVKIIIVDDCSTDGVDISYLNSNKIKVVRLKDKWWINPCIAWNTGFSMVDTDIVIMQNAECLHVGDVVDYVENNIEKNKYLCFSALSVSKKLTNKITKGKDICRLVMPYMFTPMGCEGWDGNGWYNHPLFRQVMYNFCCGILREDLHELGGFDERYADGLGFDDDEILHRILAKGMTVDFVQYPFVVHQDHPKFTPGKVQDLMSINSIKCEATKANPSFDVKPFNKIYK